MANLRDLIDCKAVDPQAKEDVFNHLKDVKDKQADLDVATTKLHTKLAPARQLIDSVDQEHPMPGQNNQQEQQFDSQGNPIPMQQNQQQKPGMQTNPASATQTTNQNMQKNGQQPQAGQKKPAFGNANKTSTKDKISNDQNSKKKQVGGKKGVEIHVKAEEDGGEDGDMDSKKSKKKRLHGRFDYHDDGGIGRGGRAIGLSGGGPGPGRHAVVDSTKHIGTGRMISIHKTKKEAKDKVASMNKKGFNYSYKKLPKSLSK
jgi:hypothetical protein